MIRGDLVTIAMQGDFGKPRPALGIQANQFGEHSSRNRAPHHQHACCRALATRHGSTECRERLAETITGDGGQNYDSEAQQDRDSLRAHRRGCTGTR